MDREELNSLLLKLQEEIDYAVSEVENCEEITLREKVRILDVLDIDLESVLVEEE